VAYIYNPKPSPTMIFSTLFFTYLSTFCSSGVHEQRRNWQVDNKPQWTLSQVWVQSTDICVHTCKVHKRGFQKSIVQNSFIHLHCIAWWVAGIWVLAKFIKRVFRNRAKFVHSFALHGGLLPFCKVTGESAAPTSAPWRMNDKWSGNNFLLGSRSLANHGWS
jgi:hypothetical protein